MPGASELLRSDSDNSTASPDFKSFESLCCKGTGQNGSLQITNTIWTYLRGKISEKIKIIDSSIEK